MLKTFVLNNEEALLKALPEDRAQLVLSQGNTFLTKGACSPLLGVGFWFCRICTHINLKIPNSVLYHGFIFKTRSSRSRILITSFLLLPLLKVLWVQQTMLLLPQLQKGSQWQWDGYYCKIFMEKKRGNITFIRKISGNCLDLACTWESEVTRKILLTWYPPEAFFCSLFLKNTFCSYNH